MENVGKIVIPMSSLHEGGVCLISGIAQFGTKLIWNSNGY